MKKIIAVLIGLPLMLLLGQCSIVQMQHNFAAQELLAGLERLPLPKDSRPFHSLWEVGNYFSGTGDATDILAYRAFVAESAEKEIRALLKPEMDRLAEKLNADVGFFRMTDSPPLFSTPIKEVIDSCPERDQDRAYVLYAADRCIENGLWDIRGW